MRNRGNVIRRCVPDPGRTLAFHARLQRGNPMNHETPDEGQRVEVRVGQGRWQAATYRHGQFIDAYGLALDPGRVVEWQATPARPPADTALH
jgi:hypothetical protein